MLRSIVHCRPEGPRQTIGETGWRSSTPLFGSKRRRRRGLTHVVPLPQRAGMTDDDEQVVPGRNPPADITAAEFEHWVTELYAAIAGEVEGLQVTPHEVVPGVDGSYDLDATVRFRWGGLAFLVLVEAKRHKNPIKRELVASLHSKVVSTGAQKGVLLATAPFQRGALKFATAHGIALIEVTEGRFSVKTASSGPEDTMSREEAAREWGVPTFVGFTVSEIDETTIGRSIVSTENVEYLVPVLLGDLAAPKDTSPPA
jgi:hypothetical protein